MQALVAESGCRAMPGYETDIVAQREEFFTDRIEQVLVIAAGKVGTANGAAEQDIADDGKALVGGEKNHVPGSMARGVYHLQFMLAYPDRIAIFQPAVRLEYFGSPEPELAALHG